MLRTRVGYAGGDKASPTYRDLHDHTETLQIDFDPKKISYQQLLDMFFTAHNPCAKAWSVQYESVLLFHDEEQKRLAEKTAERVTRERRQKVKTRITPLKTFWRAEDYHQKYRLQANSKLMRNLREIYPDAKDFTDSTTAARLNGYLAGWSEPEQIEAELPELGLDLEAENVIRKVFRLPIREAALD